MKFSGYNYPHPILGKVSDYGVLPTVTNVYSLNKEADNHRFVFEVDLVDQNLKKLLEEKKAIFACEVNCTHTFYRQLFTSFQSNIEFEIPICDLYKKVELQTFLLACKDIEDFSSNNFKEPFKNLKFQLERGDVLAILEEQELNVDVGSTDVGDILKIVEHEDKNYQGVRYFLGKDYIEVRIYKEQLETLRSIYLNPQMGDILISSLVVPALNYASFFLNAEGEKIYGEKKWFEALRIKAIEIMEDTYLSPEDVPEFIDKLLQNPNNRLLVNLLSIQQQDLQDD